MTAIEFSREARVELDAAADHYEQDYPGRGIRMIVAVPAAAPPFPGVRHDLTIRRRLVPGFPYALAYRMVGEVIRIEAVAHTHRRPGYWLPRTR